MRMLPDYLKKNVGKLSHLHEMKKHLRKYSLHTVCESARCPNIGECFSKGCATFMILGDKCTRSCAFCGVSKNLNVSEVDLLEPRRVALMARDLGLKHVVITSVTRDDLSDGGASAFAETVKEVRGLGLDMKIEVLTPDFKGSFGALKIVVDQKPDMFGHNLETIPSLYPELRKKADYKRSLKILEWVKELDDGIITKSGIMIGLGEKRKEVFQLMEDLRNVRCDLVCIGHYLRPTRKNVEVKEYVDLETFKIYEEKGYELGFNYVNSGPFVRSSYLSLEVLKRIA